ncbi:MAG: type II and III secretion system protein family protein [Acidobacteriaceae bacterium]
MVLIICTQPALRGQTSQPPQKQAEASGQDTTNDLLVEVGKTVLVDTVEPITRVTVGLGDIAEAQATSPTEVLVNGKAPGETSLIVWEQGGARQFFNVTVRPSSYITKDALDGLRRELRIELPGQPLKISAENGLIFLRGTVKDLTSSDRAIEIASTAGKVVNLLYVDVPPAEPQILLKVRFASVDRTREKQLGINVFSTGAGNLLGTITTGQYQAPTVGLSGSGSASVATVTSPLNLFLFSPNINLGATLQALETKGIVEVLAQPNLLTANGKEASFLAGGEYPYPVVQGVTGGGVGAVTIQFQEFGVRLNFIPTVTPRNTIRLQVAPEVSSLDYANGITISGFTVPGIDTRKVNTEVELRDGQSFAIGGLLDNRDTETFDKIPFLGDIPILGRLFQSMQRTRTNTELIVIVTPEIVAPIPAGAPLPELNYPTKFLPPNSKIPMQNPGPEITGAKPLPPTPPRIPIEKLMDSMKPETPLVIQSGTGGYGGGQGTRGGSGSMGASTP